MTSAVADSLAQLEHASPGDIVLFSQPEGGLGPIISFVTRSTYYHVAIFERDTFTIEAPARCRAAGPPGQRGWPYLDRDPGAAGPR